MFRIIAIRYYVCYTKMVKSDKSLQGFSSFSSTADGGTMMVVMIGYAKWLMIGILFGRIVSNDTVKSFMLLREENQMMDLDFRRRAGSI